MQPPPAARLTIRGTRLVPVEVPMRFALGTSLGTIRSAPLLLLDLQTEEGVTGRTYLWCYSPTGARVLATLIEDAVLHVKGQPVAPVDVAAVLTRRFALAGVVGFVRMALSAIDAALWDALAIAAGLPLASYLGSAPRRLKAYNSNGLGLMEPEAVAAEALALLDGGFKAVKLRLGRARFADDLAAMRAVRRRIPDEVEIMVDCNQGLTAVEAIRRGRVLQDEGISWYEEPIRHDDHAANAQIARELAVPVQLGENFNGPEAMAAALAMQACDLVMPDLARIGGVTGWLHAAGLAAACGIPMSSHLFPEVSAHLLCATPTCHWLEYVDWANALVQEPLRIENGEAVVPDRPGTGLVWDEQALAVFVKL